MESRLFRPDGKEINVEDDRNGGHDDGLWIFIEMLKRDESGFRNLV